eukprot:3444570-Amphidinium_carterae.1
MSVLTERQAAIEDITKCSKKWNSEVPFHFTRVERCLTPQNPPNPEKNRVTPKQLKNNVKSLGGFWGGENSFNSRVSRQLTEIACLDTRFFGKGPVSWGKAHGMQMLKRSVSWGKDASSRNWATVPKSCCSGAIGA